MQVFKRLFILLIDFRAKMKYNNIVKGDKMSKKKHDNQNAENVQLIKQTLMASAFPALITHYEGEDGERFVKGFLPGFKDNEVSDMLDEDECVQYLQDLLDDKVEELVVEGKMLPDVEEDEELIKKHPGYQIVYLDINVYALPDECCHHHCHECNGSCDCDEEYYDCDCEDDCDCECEDCNDDCCDDDCDCGCGNSHHDCGCGGEHCNCGDDCHCTEENHCSSDCGCWKK